MDSQRSLKQISFLLGGVALLLLIASAILGYQALRSINGQTSLSPQLSSDTALINSRLHQVKERGHLLCGIEGGLTGFSQISGEVAFTDKEYPFYQNASGFDADLCRVVAVAIFGSSEDHLFFTQAAADNRFELVRTGIIDVLIRNTTWTVSRDIGLGVDFGPVIYHDGQKFLAPIDSGIQALADLDGQSICVLPHTTTVENLTTALDQLTVTYTLITERRPNEDFRDTEDVIEAYLRQKCTVMAGDESQLLARHMELVNPDDHTLFPQRAISYEPLAPVVIENDSRWRDVVAVAVLATIYAEELGIDSGNVEQYVASTTLLNQQFLGIPDARINEYVGPLLGLEQGFTQNIIKQVGNYGEIFDRNLGDIVTTRGPNQSWKLDNEGRFFAPPWQAAINPTTP